LIIICNTDTADLMNLANKIYFKVKDWCWLIFAKIDV
jgi:hypothetical protein